MTEKHVLTGRKRDMLGNQTFEVLQPLKRTVYTIPFTYFTYLSHSRHLNHLISEILEQRNITNSKAFQLWCESLLNGRRTSNVWLPSMSCLRPVRTCFSVTCPRLDENDGICKTSLHPLAFWLDHIPRG